jgi:plastocyanin
MLIYRNNKKRCMKKFFVVLAILFIGILLAGCTSQPAAPAATPTPTVVPTTIVSTAVPTPLPTTEVVVVVVNKTQNATPTPTPTKQPSATITFNSDLTISPGTTVYIPVGGKVIWVNNDPRYPHAIQAIDVQTAKYFGGMDTVTIPYGTPLEVTFDKVGYYSYKTVFQQEMDGIVIVTK